MKRCAKALSSKGKSNSTSSDSSIRTTNMDAADESLPIVGKTALMQNLYRFVARLMNSELPVLISGESGTGKTLVAQVLHDFSDRRNMPLVRMRADDLVELDGPSKILARAKDGTILIEEISDLGPTEQGRLVSMIDSPGEYSPRFLATLVGDKTEAVDKYKVRRDLFYRLGGAPITVPPLRERFDDIPLLASFFLEKVDRETGISRNFDQAAMKLIQSYTWPGNIRELRNVIERASVLFNDRSVSGDNVKENLLRLKVPDPDEEQDELWAASTDLVESIDKEEEVTNLPLPKPEQYKDWFLYFDKMDLRKHLRDIEIVLIEAALEKVNGSVGKAADLLKIRRTTLIEKIKKFVIEKPIT